MIKKHRVRRTTKRKFNIKLKRATLFSIAQIFFFSLAGLIIVSFARKGVILISLNSILVSTFSWATLLFPFIFISFGFLLSKFKFPLGQPNVIVGAILFAISVAALTQAGLAGRNAWDGVSALVTPAGAFIILSGTTLVGLIILFNTSLDQVFAIIVGIVNQVKKYTFGGTPFPRNLAGASMKVSGVGTDTQPTRHAPRPDSGKGRDVLAPKLVTNIPGEEKVWEYPPASILTETQSGKADRGDIKGNAGVIERTLDSFGITAKVVEVNLGPAVTQYAIEVALGTKLSKITALERDLALALAAPTGTIRIEAPIPGRSLVGIELPNRTPEFVPLKKMMDSDNIRNHRSKLAVALGLDVAGKPIVADIAKMPHVLIAGQTGSGKSVCINTFLACLLFRAAPSEVKFILVDPKRVELTGYNNIPHLLTPVIVEPEKVISALRWTLAEMDRRYKIFSQAGVRNIDAYNEMSGFQALPYIILMIDELADIMLFSPVEVEDAVTRIAQMSRATGIHMVLSTQRPSVDVITGLIKANIPSRIAFAVASQVDSRVILDQQGAEKLLGRGDMLYLPPDQAKPMRIQGAYVSDNEVNRLITFLRNQGVQPQYTEEVTSMPSVAKGGPGGAAGGDRDSLFDESVKIICQYDKASASLLQRRLSIGYARAARILDQLESSGVVGPADGSKPREVLVKNAEQFLSGNSPQADTPQAEVL